MPTILQFRRGTTAQNNNYTGSTGELTVDTDLYVLRVHDGSTAGGNVELVANSAAQTLTNKTLSDFTLTGNITGDVLPSANITYDLGSATQRWNDLYLANSTIYLGASQISANATAVTITNPSGGDFVLAAAGDSSQTEFVGTSVQAASIGNSGAVLSGTYEGSTIAVAYGGTGATTSTGSGAVVLGTSPTFSTKITTPVIEKSGSDGVGDIGQSGNKYATIYATTFSGEASSALYADLAEKYVADRYYEPGTVMVFGGQREVTESMLDYETAVAGVVSTKPAYLMNSEQQGEFVVDIALVGRVPCKVMGPVFKGSVLVTSEHGGVAKAIDNSKFIPGCIIGRAMEDHIEEGIIKTIEVSVGRS